MTGFPAGGRLLAEPSARWLAGGGETTVDRRLVNNSSNTFPGSGQLLLAGFTATLTENIGTIMVPSGNAAAAPTPTLVQFALYSVDTVGGGLTLVGNTANDTSIFAGASVRYSRPLLAPVLKVAGQRYAVGILIVSPAGMPNLPTTSAVSPTVPDTTMPLMEGQSGGHPSLPAIVNANAFSVTGWTFYAELTP